MAIQAVILAALAGLAGAAPGISNIQTHTSSDNSDWRSKITNVVVLVEENRSFDSFAGGLTYNSTIDGLLHHNYCNSLNASDPSEAADICAGPLAADVASDDPNHSISGVNMQLFSTFHPNETAVAQAADWEYETMRGFVTEQSITFDTLNKTRAAEAINYYTPEHIPVFNAIAENFVLFDRWFCSVPGPTNPNRAYITSGTSHGHGENDDAFDVYGLPQKSIFQALSENNITWTNYQNSTTGPGLGFNPDAAFYSWTAESGANVTNIKAIEHFYTDAAAGTLPQFTYINPECCSYQSFHPPSPIVLGEIFIKGIYEAIRNSPQWNTTLFILTFDEHGGFGDHVPPPVNVPAGDDLTYTETAQDGQNITFAFDRLGVRVPTVLISPWVGKGLIENQGQNYGGEYTHTSILNFLSQLWGVEQLTPRVEYSSTFEHLILDTIRSDDDSPSILPEPVAW
ncbi:phosphoesterase [Cryphonectria parasitica EP155]|uniref:Phosphoesterase n=1 Tax=Cryphonectria parasitica (strain ATCC 38755 / EP155) TaxID=660469 RepID=A0A9P5CJN6_CRYP1|nr:phosphoesterase [Cryphonectria parasitica EP155]KAF3759905.1 phosphoesterase [Cryphonectria parasitica EP155]